MTDRTPPPDLLSRNWGWLVAAGIILVVVGVVAIAAPFVSSLAVTAWIGFAFIIAGAGHFAHAMNGGEWRSVVGAIVIGLAYIAGGVFIIFNPAESLLAFSVLVVAMLLVSGLMRLWAAFQMRPEKGWGWLALMGAVSLLAAVVIYASFPGAALWLLGTIAGIVFLIDGWALLILGMAARAARRG